MDQREKDSQFANSLQTEQVDRFISNMDSAKSTRYSQMQLVRAHLKFASAQKWRKNNPALWAFIKRVARECVDRGETVSGAYLLHVARSRDWIDNAGHAGGINNDFAPIITRWLILDNPELAPYIEKRESIMDIVMNKSES